MAQQPDYDVAIIGGGPAGATAARLLAGSFKVALIDGKSPDPDSFHKPCGGLLAGDAQQALSRYHLTLPKDILVDPQIFAVKTIDLKSGLIRHYQRFYINLDRHKFDLWLLSLIPDGVTRIIGRCIGVERSERGFCVSYSENGASRRLHCRWLLGADGADSLVRRQLFPEFKPHSYMAIQEWYEERHHDPFYSCVFDPETSDCCSWSISKDNRFVFGGAFPVHGCAVAFERQKAKLAAYGYDFGPPLLREACLVLRPRRPADIFIGDGDCLLLGEAAGMISPSSLEGFSWAIRSAEAAAKSLTASKPARAYRRHTLPLRLKLYLKIIKCPFLYWPRLRYLVMKSGLKAIKMHDE